MQASSFIPSSCVDAATLLRHQRFEDAARLYVRSNLDACEQNFNVRAIFGNAARHVAFSLIATLSARAELVSGEMPLSQSRVIDFIARMGMSSHGKIEALIRRMIDQGMIVQVPFRQDRRLKALQPTETFLAIDDLLCAIHARPCALLADDPLLHAIAAGRRASTRRMRVAAMPLIEGGGAMLQRNPEMLPFLMADAGLVTLYALVDAHWRGDCRAQKIDAIARLCGVSRPHVRTLFNIATSQGLMEQGAAGLFVPVPALLGIMRRWIAECLAAFMGCCQMAQDQQDAAASCA